jgi:hypothetical protein
MDADQRQKLDSAEAGLEVLNENDDVWTGQEAWENAQADLVAIIAQIYSTETIASSGNTGPATNKKNIRLDNAEKATIICGPLRAFFINNHDEEQEASIHFSKSELGYAPEKTLLARWKKIIDVANLPANAAFFTGGYGVTHAMVTDLVNGRAAFVAASPKPKAARATISAAKKVLKTNFKTLNLVVKNVGNLAQGKIGTNKSFVEALESAFGLTITGNRLENAVLTFRDAETGVLIYKVKATFSKGKHSFVKYSTKKGRITIKGKEQGNWKALIEAETYVNQNLINVAFDPEKPILKLEIKLVKA